VILSQDSIRGLTPHFARVEINCASLALAKLTPLLGSPGMGSMAMLPKINY